MIRFIRVSPRKGGRARGRRPVRASGERSPSTFNGKSSISPVPSSSTYGRADVRVCTTDQSHLSRPSSSSTGHSTECNELGISRRCFVDAISISCRYEIRNFRTYRGIPCIRRFPRCAPTRPLQLTHEKRWRLGNDVLRQEMKFNFTCVSRLWTFTSSMEK